VVDLLAAYSNRPELLRPLAEVLRRVERAGAEPGAAYKEERPLTQTPGRRRRLAPDEIESLVELYLAGTRQTDLAAKFGISLSGVKWVLRQRSVRRGR
jgi:DNA invertase Pin-like site-specific DNA recombinase